jgi:hypothetical protein
MDSGFRRNDKKGAFESFTKTPNLIYLENIYFFLCALRVLCGESVPYFFLIRAAKNPSIR